MQPASLVRVLAQVFLVGVTVLILATATTAQGGPPPRPEVFRNPEELRTYLKDLNEYFAVVGRPRFGKRGMHSSPSSFRNEVIGTVLSDLDLNGDGQISPEEYELYSIYFE